MLDRRTMIAAALGAAAAGALGMRAAGAAGAASEGALSFVADPELGLIPVCRGNLQVADAVGGNAANLVGERADFDLMEKLGLLEGHLMIGKALLEARMTADAMPHFGHPVRELYAYIQPQVERRGLAPFDGELAALETQARSGAGGPFAQMYAGAIRRLDALRATVPAERMAQPAFMLGVISQLVSDVASDYGEAIERGRISNTVEYHDAMGFLGYCERLTDRLQRGASGRAQQAYAATMRELQGAQRGFPALRPPTRPPLTVSAIRGHAARIADLAKDA